MIKQVLTTTFTAKQLLNLDKTSTSKFHCKSRLVLIFTLSAWIRWKWTMLNPIIQFWLSQKRGKNLNCVAEPKVQEFRSVDYTGEKGFIFLIEYMIVQRQAHHLTCWNCTAEISNLLTREGKALTVLCSRWLWSGQDLAGRSPVWFAASMPPSCCQRSNRPIIVSFFNFVDLTFMRRFEQTQVGSRNLLKETSKMCLEN